MRLLYQGASAVDAGNVRVEGLSSGPLSLHFGLPLPDGATVLVWDQRNDAGQDVAGGTYILKLQSTDPWGKVTAHNHAVGVLLRPQPASLVLYNAAGEAVRHYDPAALGLDPVDLGRAEPGRVELKDRQGGLAWFDLDGLNDHGQPLAGGSYHLVLRYAEGMGTHTVVRAVVVVPLPGGDPLEGAGLERNPVPPGQPLVIRHRPCDCSLRARLYDLSGGLVATAGGDGQGRLELGSGDLAGGVYLVDLWLEAPGERPQRRVIKAAVLR